MGLDIVELVMDVEREFGLQIPNAEAKRFRTVGLLFDYVRANTTQVGPPERGDPYAGPLWDRYLRVVSRSVGVPRADLRPEHEFVRDLRLD